MSDPIRISAVPTNVITGFLGVGKTTAIINLLKQKRCNERWAVLVNEFGEVGIDGELFQGQFSEERGVFIREVPGGCMCCSSGFSMQIALAQLLNRAKPHRLLIEPTGLGHPIEVLQVLSADHYRDTLEIQKTVTLVDARQLSNPKFYTHQTYQQHVEVSDVIVGNKVDLYSNKDKESLKALYDSHNSSKTLVFAREGRFDVSLLTGCTLNQAAKSAGMPRFQLLDDLGKDWADAFSETGVVEVENAGNGYRSRGWRFSADQVFNYDSLFTWFSGLQVERAKGVFITDRGVFGYNLSGDVLTEIELDDCLGSKVEVINPVD
ncbi:GTP-binding protein [Aurantivibrio plasticivorans]